MTETTKTSTPAETKTAAKARKGAASRRSRVREKAMTDGASATAVETGTSPAATAELPQNLDAFIKTLTSEKARELDEIAARFGSVDAREAEDAFEQGAWVERLYEIIPAEMTLSSFIETRCARTLRSARQYRQVHQNLSSHRKIAVELRVHPTTLIALAASTVSPEQIEAVFEMYRAEERPSVSAVKKYLKSGMSGSDGTDGHGPADAGGVSGLGAKARERVSADAKRFVAILVAIGNVAFKALETHKGKDHKIRSVLAKALPNEARLARAILLTMISSPNAPAGSEFITVEVDRSGRWGEVEKMLEVLANPKAYPHGRDATIWIAEQVLPAITWAIGKDPSWRSDLARKAVAAPAFDAGDALADGLADDGGEAEVETPMPEPLAQLATVGGDNVIDFEPQSSRPR